jgi:hypothetical protein
MSIRQAMLALLEQGPMYGYQLRAEFEQRTGETWPLNIGQVYTTLSRLERDGLVEVVDHGGAAWAPPPSSRSVSGPAPSRRAAAGPAWRRARAGRSGAEGRSW